MSLERELEGAWRRAELQRYNLAVLGATGVGKSSLINAVFGEDLAKTGIGAPVTQHVSLYKNREGTLGLYDFKGSESFEELRAFVRNFEQIYRERVEEGEPIHGLWFCIKASDRRFDAKQRELITELADLGIPVMLVVTQTPWKPDVGFPADVIEFLRYLGSLGLPIQTGGPIPVAAMGDDFSGTKPHGLERLVQISLQAAPKGVSPALAAAQRIDRDAKHGAANKVIGAATTAATLVGATPIPIADAAPLMGIQLMMMRQTATIFGISLGQQAMTAAVTQLAAATAGKTIATGLLKLVPGAGWVITGSVAGTITAATGYAWLRLCEGHYDGKINLFEYLESDDLMKSLLGLLKQQLEGQTPGLGGKGT